MGVREDLRMPELGEVFASEPVSGAAGSEARLTADKNGWTRIDTER